MVSMVSRVSMVGVRTRHRVRVRSWQGESGCTAHTDANPVHRKAHASDLALSAAALAVDKTAHAAVVTPVEEGEGGFAVVALWVVLICSPFRPLQPEC